MRLTSLGILMVVIGLAFAFAALTSQSSLLVLLAGLVWGCLGVNFWRAWRSVKSLRLVAPSVSHVEEKSTAGEPWEVINESARPISAIKANHPEGVLFELAWMGPREHRHVAPKFGVLRRGVYVWKDVQLQTAHPFGLVSARRCLALTGELVVYPALYVTASPLAAGYDAMVGGKHRGRRRVASGTHFAGVRPWQSGDPFKQIHWASSAKGMGLMVKTYEEELAGRMAVLLDSGHTGDRQAADACVRAAGSLLFAALDEGHHVEWMVLGTHAPELIPPFSDGHEYLDALARLPVKPGGLTLSHLQDAYGKISGRCAVVLVVTTVNDAVVQSVQSWLERRPVVTVCVPAPARQWPALAGAAVWEYGEDYLAPAA